MENEIKQYNDFLEDVRIKYSNWDYTDFDILKNSSSDQISFSTHIKLTVKLGKLLIKQIEILNKELQIANNEITILKKELELERNNNNPTSDQN